MKSLFLANGLYLASWDAGHLQLAGWSVPTPWLPLKDRAEAGPGVSFSRDSPVAIPGFVSTPPWRLSCRAATGLSRLIAAPVLVPVFGSE
jgi:hypothetical protein